VDTEQRAEGMGQRAIDRRLIIVSHRRERKERREKTIYFKKLCEK
jgi:hypothetical protein